MLPDADADGAVANALACFNNSAAKIRADFDERALAAEELLQACQDAPAGSSVGQAAVQVLVVEVQRVLRSIRSVLCHNKGSPALTSKREVTCKRLEAVREAAVQHARIAYGVQCGRPRGVRGAAKPVAQVSGGQRNSGTAQKSPESAFSSAQEAQTAVRATSWASRKLAAGRVALDVDEDDEPTIPASQEEGSQTRLECQARVAGAGTGAELQPGARTVCMAGAENLDPSNGDSTPGNCASLQASEAISGLASGEAEERVPSQDLLKAEQWDSRSRREAPVRAQRRPRKEQQPADPEALAWERIPEEVHAALQTICNHGQAGDSTLPSLQGCPWCERSHSGKGNLCTKEWQQGKKRKRRMVDPGEGQDRLTPPAPLSSPAPSSQPALLLPQKATDEDDEVLPQKATGDEDDEDDEDDEVVRPESWSFVFFSSNQSDGVDTPTEVEGAARGEHVWQKGRQASTPASDGGEEACGGTVPCKTEYDERVSIKLEHTQAESLAEHHEGSVAGIQRGTVAVACDEPVASVGDLGMEVPSDVFTNALDNFRGAMQRKGRHMLRLSAAQQLLRACASDPRHMGAEAAVKELWLGMQRTLRNLHSKKLAPWKLRDPAQRRQREVRGRFQAFQGVLRAHVRRCGYTWQQRVSLVSRHFSAGQQQGKAVVGEPVSSLEELRLRCPEYQRTGRSRHLCDQLCYFREYEPARQLQALRDRALDHPLRPSLAGWSARLAVAREAPFWQVVFHDAAGAVQGSSRDAWNAALKAAPTVDATQDEQKGALVPPAGVDASLLESPFGLVEELLTEKPWQLLVACQLLNRTSRLVVDRILAPFFQRWPTPAALLTANPTELERWLAPLGLHHKRSRRLLRFSEEYLKAVSECGEPLPPDRVEHLPGVGRYACDAHEIFVRAVPAGTVRPTDVYLNWFVDYQLCLERG